MHRRTFLATAGAAALAGSAKALGSPNASSVNFGADLSPVQFQGVQSPLGPGALEGTFLEVKDKFPPNARRVVLDNLPPPMAQGGPGHLGSPGSCEACSWGYGLGTYTGSREIAGPRAGWDSNDPHDQVSAAWLYQWQHASTGKPNSCPTGSMCIPYLTKMLRDGAASTADAPYNPQHRPKVAGMCAYIETLNTTGTPFPGMDRFVIGSYKSTGIGGSGNQAKYLPVIKNLLRNRHAIAFSGLVPKDINAPVLAPNGVYHATPGFYPNSGHGQMIVGYDDALGALLVQNSMGANWNPGPAHDVGHNGRIWYAYEAFFAGQKVIGVAWPKPPAAVPGTVLPALTRGAPVLKVVNARVHDTPNYSRLVLVLYASAPLNVKSLAAHNPRSGHHFTATINELLRIGYQYIQEPAGTFKPKATFDMTIQALANGTPVTYRGPVKFGPL